VQGVTRPEGAPIEHTSIPFLISIQNAGQQQNIGYMKDRINDMRKMADLMTRQIDLTKRMYALQQQLTTITHDSIDKTRDMAVVLDELRDRIGRFDDFFRPIRNYFYWEPHCYDIPICSSLRSIFDLMALLHEPGSGETGRHASGSEMS
jgi:RND superfamily putative drug exporter